MASGLIGDDNLRGELRYWFKKWFNEGGSRKISLLLTGKTGVGKSRLVNSLIGSKVAKEGRAKDPCTKKVNSYRTTVAGVEVTIWDSPGLQDGTEFESAYIQDISSSIKEVDLVIYCLKMDDTRLRDEDLKAMRILTEVFGNKLWDNAVFALTFANKVEDPDADDDSPAASKVYFMKDLFKWEEALCKYLPLKAGINASIVDRIPKIPTGDKRKLMLPNGENWLTEFWVQCYERMKMVCRVNLLNVNKQRINFLNNLDLHENKSQSFSSVKIENKEYEPCDQSTLRRQSPSQSRNKNSGYPTECSHERYSSPPNITININVGSPEGTAPKSDSSKEHHAEPAKPNVSANPSETSSYPDLNFNPSQTQRVEKSTWESFKDWVADKWEGVKKVVKFIAKGAVFVLSWIF